MFKIVRKEALTPHVTRMAIEAPRISRKARPGQFIIFRNDEFGERVPLTVADTDPDAGTVTVIVQGVGKATQTLAAKEVGDGVLDFVGPLGRPSELGTPTRACVIGGGVGSAIAYPEAKALHAQGTAVDVIAGFRSKDAVILEADFARVADRVYLMTDDGTAGEHGFVTDKLRQLIDDGAAYDLVIAIGPVPMMKAVSELTRPHGIRTLVSLNPIMVDGTGMCGGCRVTVDGVTRFACVDGPEFDGHRVDYDDLMLRNRAYRKEEADHLCRMTGEVRRG